MSDEMQRKQAQLATLPVHLLDEFEVFNFTPTPEGSTGRAPVIDVVLTTIARDQTRTTRRVRMGPNALAALVGDLQAALLRAQGTPPPTH